MRINLDDYSYKRKLMDMQSSPEYEKSFCSETSIFTIFVLLRLFVQIMEKFLLKQFVETEKLEECYLRLKSVKNF